MPSKYLCRVTSRPMTCDDKIWEQWYADEHIPDLVDHKSSTRAAFYREIFDVPDLYAHNQGEDKNKFMAIYQTEYEDMLTSDGVKAIRHTSDILPDKANLKNGEFDNRNYELIHEFDPNGLGDTPAPYILYAELELAEEKELDAFYREERFPMLAKVPGYRRGLRYKLGPATPMTVGSPPKFVAFHEFEKVHGITDSQEMKDVMTTPWTLKTMAGVTFANIRSWELVKAVGY
ncbi:hypothetical protein BJ878DRAFT_515209 [Calycina marina]|uniref:Uncharacterized protein n=1 Tax=Calycina marina TaxID=1763456 RepID=A0A9P7Z084_9HELO|nr:hypothetical protein BJ878DRAFT_515209 [Calycina marina]